MEDKIRALLAKAEATDNPHEAEIFQRKAFELMVKYGIDKDALKPGEVKEDFTRRVVVVPGKYMFQKVNFSGHVYDFFGCYVSYRSRNTYGGPRKTTVTLYGRPSKIDRLEDFLLDMWEYGERTYQAYKGSKGPGFLQTWWEHYGAAIASRLREATKNVEEEQNVSLVPALRSEVELARISAGKLGSGGYSGSGGYNPSGAAAGRKAGSNATLAKGKLSGGRKQLGSGS